MVGNNVNAKGYKSKVNCTCLPEHKQLPQSTRAKKIWNKKMSSTTHRLVCVEKSREKEMRKVSRRTWKAFLSAARVFAEHALRS